MKNVSAKKIVAPPVQNQKTEETVSGCELLAPERFKALVLMTKEALKNFRKESFAQIKERILREQKSFPDYALIEDNWVAIERTSNSDRFKELVAIGIGLVIKYEGDKNAAVKKTGKNDFFQFIGGEVLSVCQDDSDYIRVQELIGAIVGTAMNQRRLMLEEEAHQAERNQLYENAGKDVATWAQKNPVIIFGDPAIVGNMILDSEKSLSTQGMLRRQVIEYVNKMTKQEKLEIFYTAAHQAVDSYFTANSKELFLKGETNDQFKLLAENVRLSSEELTFIGSKYEVFATISRAIMSKRETVATTWREAEKKSLMATGLSLMKKRVVKNPGSARRRHAVKYPNGIPTATVKKNESNNKRK